MANRIVHRSSSTPGAVPSAATLVPGELAINTATGGLYTLLSDNVTVRPLISPGGVAVPRIASPTWAGAMTLDWSTADLFRITLGGTTALTFTGAVDGQKLLLELTQDATGSRVATFPATVRYSVLIPAITLSSTAGKLDRCGFVYNAAAATYDLVALATGF